MLLAGFSPVQHAPVRRRQARAQHTGQTDHSDPDDDLSEVLLRAQYSEGLRGDFEIEDGVDGGLYRAMSFSSEYTVSATSMTPSASRRARSARDRSNGIRTAGPPATGRAPRTSSA